MENELKYECRTCKTNTVKRTSVGDINMYVCESCGETNPE